MRTVARICAVLNVFLGGINIAAGHPVLGTTLLIIGVLGIGWEIYRIKEGF